MHSFKVGLTVAATFPAAVVAMAALRALKGTILEENVARTTASVGEALIAGAIFTIPAFVISGAWEELDYLQGTLIMLIGGTLGVLFIIILRRSLVEEAELPFPESVAASEIVKAGQGGQTGASFVFASMEVLLPVPSKQYWVATILGSIERAFFSMSIAKSIFSFSVTFSSSGLKLSTLV